MSEGDTIHGTYRAYVHYGCRCEKCQAMNADKQRKAREKRKARLDDPDHKVPHGTLGGYTNHCCRCVKCREAKRLYERGKAAKEKEG